MSRVGLTWSQGCSAFQRLTSIFTRIDPAVTRRLKLGDAYVIHNARGNADDALHSFVISKQLLRTHETLFIKHIVCRHTGCKLLTLKNEDAPAALEKNLGLAA